jgi:hypothetical protein
MKMKQNYLLFILILFIPLISKAQLAGTKWSGTMNVPTETNVSLEFKADTLFLAITDMGIIGETMLYTVKDSVITLKKVSGNSPCDIGGAFTVKFKTDGNRLFISVLNDPCDERKNAWTNQPFYKK